MGVPVFIGGLERSGTSMIRAIIGSHPDIAIFEYDLPLWRSIYPEHRKYWGETSNKSLSERILDAIYTNEKFHQSAYQPDRSTIESSLDSIELNEVESYALLAAKVFEIFLEQYRLLRGRERWGLKTPENEFFADEILAAYPEGKFVHVYRNIFSVTSSLKKLGWLRPGDVFLVKHVIKWNRSIELLLTNTQRYRGRYLGINYNHFVEDPETYLRLTCSFLGIEFDKRMLEMRDHPGGWKGSNSAFSISASTISPELANRPVDNLTDHEISVIKAICLAYELHMKERYPEFNLNRLEAECLNQFGEDLFLNGEEEAALLAFSKAIDIDPTYGAARKNLQVVHGGDVEPSDVLGTRVHRSLVRFPNITDLRPHVTGVYITLRCQACGHTFERYQPTVAGIAIGRHFCPGCGAVSEVRPEDFEAALGRYLPPLSFEEMLQLNQEATRIAETWYRARPLAELLTYRGINLGEPTERELLSFITLGLYATQPSGEDSA